MSGITTHLDFLFLKYFLVINIKSEREIKSKYRNARIVRNGGSREIKALNF